MSLVINHNLMAMNAPRNLNSSFSALATSTRRLSSDLKLKQGESAAAQPAGETLAVGTPEQVGGSLLNTSDAAAGSPQAAQGKVADMASQDGFSPKDLAAQPLLGRGLQTAISMGLFTPSNSDILTLLK